VQQADCLLITGYCLLALCGSKEPTPPQSGLKQSLVAAEGLHWDLLILISLVGPTLTSASTHYEVPDIRKRLSHFLAAVGMGDGDESFSSLPQRLSMQIYRTEFGEHRPHPLIGPKSNIFSLSISINSTPCLLAVRSSGSHLMNRLSFRRFSLSDAGGEPGEGNRDRHEDMSRFVTRLAS
jgi:hypothetical protein